jgi:hypothetical protein
MNHFISLAHKCILIVIKRWQTIFYTKALWRLDNLLKFGSPIKGLIALIICKNGHFIGLVLQNSNINNIAHL